MKLFETIEKEKIIAEDDYFMIVFDKYPNLMDLIWE